MQAPVFDTLKIRKHSLSFTMDAEIKIEVDEEFVEGFQPSLNNVKHKLTSKPSNVSTDPVVVKSEVFDPDISSLQEGMDIVQMRCYSCDDVFTNLDSFNKHITKHLTGVKEESNSKSYHERFTSISHDNIAVFGDLTAKRCLVNQGSLTDDGYQLNLGNGHQNQINNEKNPATISNETSDGDSTLQSCHLYHGSKTVLGNKPGYNSQVDHLKEYLNVKAENHEPIAAVHSETVSDTKRQINEQIKIKTEPYDLASVSETEKDGKTSQLEEELNSDSGIDEKMASFGPKSGLISSDSAYHVKIKTEPEDTETLERQINENTSPKEEILYAHTGTNKTWAKVTSEMCTLTTRPKNTRIEPNDTLKFSNKKVYEKRFKCDLCNSGFISPSDLKLHMRTHSGEKPNICDICNIGFATTGNLKQHIRIHTGEKPFKCATCNKAFIQNNNLKVHMRIHSGEKPYKCDFCETHFRKSCQLKVHLRRHTGEKPFKCDVCGAYFSEKLSLTEHARSHTGEKPYPCTLCDLRFSRAGCLRKHLHLHTGKKPYKCHECMSAFATTSGLERHKRIHTADKPYKCKSCHASFAQSTHLKIHIRMHTGEKPYKCDKCNRSFAQTSGLKSHLRVHTGEKPFHCVLCKAAYRHKVSLQAHVKTHTTVKKETHV